MYSDNRTLRTADIKNNYNVWIVDKQRNVKSYLFLFIQCHNFIGADDFVEIAGGNGFELGFLNVRGRYCGMEANVGKKPLLLLENIMMTSYLYCSIKNMPNDRREKEIG